MRRLLVNDALGQLGEVTMWHRLQEWFGCEFVGGPFEVLADSAFRYALYSVADEPPSLLIRNATWFPPIEAGVPTISLLQDIFTEGPQRQMQEAVIRSSRAAVFNSAFTASRYPCTDEYEPPVRPLVLPLPVDFSLFEPGNPMGLQQALSLPEGCICWVGACQGAAARLKGWDIFVQVVRANPDLHFVAVLKDAMPSSQPPNLRCFVRLTQADLVKVIGACRMGLCTSRLESQHLAGIEMGACGLPLVVPPVGTYYNRLGFPISIVSGDHVAAYSQAIRNMLIGPWLSDRVRDQWRGEFDVPVIRAQWETLVAEVEAQ